MSNEMRLVNLNSVIEQLENEWGYEGIREDLQKLPTVDAAPVVYGRWLYKWDADRDPKKLFVRIVCSECNLHTGQKSNYCPYCGAKMDGGNEDG